MCWHFLPSVFLHFNPHQMNKHWRHWKKTEINVLDKISLDYKKRYKRKIFQFRYLLCLSESDGGNLHDENINVSTNEKKALGKNLPNLFFTKNSHSSYLYLHYHHHSNFNLSLEEDPKKLNVLLGHQLWNLKLSYF